MIFTAKYYDTNSTVAICNPHSRSNGGSNYDTLPRPGQSPDGTKVSYHSEFLNASSNRNDVYWAVAYYPYPPELTNSNGSAGAVTIRFDWRLDQPTPRGYTRRGWPNESTNTPPPPRETEPVLFSSTSIVNLYFEGSLIDAEITLLTSPNACVPNNLAKSFLSLVSL